MSTSTAPRPRVKPLRTVRLLAHNLFRVVEGKAVADYAVQTVPTDWGKGFRVAKIVHADEIGVETEDPYHVHLDEATGHSCECMGHLRHGHKTRCRHVGAILTLLAKGLLRTARDARHAPEPMPCDEPA